MLGKLFLGRAHELEGQLAAQRAELLDFPASVQLGDSTITLRPIEAQDRDAILRFARRLPQHDLLFLRRNITEPDQVDAWLRDITDGSYSSIAAVEGDDIVGYATVARDGMDWTAHVAELRVLVASRFEPSARLQNRRLDVHVSSYRMRRRLGWSLPFVSVIVPRQTAVLELKLSHVSSS